MKKAKGKNEGLHGFTRSLRSRAFRAGSYSVAAAAVVIAIAVVINLIVGAIPASYTKLDITSQGLYSLSDQTEKLLAGLTQDEIDIYWIVQSGSEDSTLGGLLARYESTSDRVRVIKKDPVVYPSFASQYTTSKVYDNSLVVVCGDRSKYVGESDIFVTDYSSYYTTGTTSTQFDGENQITSAIDYVTSENLPVVYTLTGHGESDLPTDLESAVTGDNFLVESLSLLSQSTVPEDAGCLIIYAPQSDISEAEKDILLSYLEGGGRLLLVTDYAKTEKPNLAAVMAYYGTSLVDGIVIEGDADHCLRGYSYYLLPNLGSHEVTSSLQSGNYYVLMPIAQGIEVADPPRDSVSVTKILTSSSDAFSKIAGYDITTYEKEAGDIDGPFALGVAVSETVEDGETQIVWLTTSEMFTADNNQLVSGANYDLFLGALGWMCERENSISIHAKSLDATYLTVPSSAVSLWSLVMVALVPLAPLALGAVITVRRRHR
ncbi:MAG TPA: GldG family protein [Oscillospiraceae bacterium]|nr:GldG family protein [Oscillospiraceae bacterium]